MHTVYLASGVGGRGVTLTIIHTHIHTHTHTYTHAHTRTHTVYTHSHKHTHIHTHTHTLYGTRSYAHRVSGIGGRVVTLSLSLLAFFLTPCYIAVLAANLSSQVYTNDKNVQQNKPKG